MAPVFKINALRVLMIGKAKKYFDLWEADRDPTDAAKTHEEFLNRVKDYARRRKLDSSAKEKMQHGGDPMDVGAVGGWSWEGYDQDGVCAIGFKGKSKGKGGKGKGECYNCESTGHFSRESLQPYTGKGEHKGFPHKLI